MITRENLNEVINQLSEKDQNRLLNAESFEYVVLELHVFNSGSVTTMKLTNDYNKYQNVSNNGNAILYTNEIQDIIINQLKG